MHSPTFSLVHEYETAKMPIIHCDFYRLDENSDFADFGGAEFFAAPSLYLVEWADKVKLLQSTNSERFVELHLEHDASGRILFFPSLWQIVD